ILGAAQQGWHGEKRQTWGHAGATNSRGQILDIVHTEGTSLITVPFDLAEQDAIRASMPLIQHRKIINF
ncbi:MAG: carbon-nitrogen hydrolase family protein, partial [Acinetobacter sp.]